MEQLSLFETIPENKTQSRKVSSKDYISALAELENSFERHAYLLTHGGSDPFWSDGVNLNLVRNHILYYKNILLEYSKNSLVTLPEIFYKETPARVDNDYQAPGTKSGKFYQFTH